MTSRRLLLQIGGLLLADLALRVPAAGASASVEIGMVGNADGSVVRFEPAGVLVAPGQEIRWINRDAGNSHTTTAYHPGNRGRPLRIPQGAKSWDSDYLLPGEAFSLRLDVPGVYDYCCRPHEHAGMVGRILVGNRESKFLAAPPLPPPRNLPSVEEILASAAWRGA